MYKVNPRTLSNGKNYSDKAKFEYGNELVDIPSYFEPNKDKISEKDKNNKKRFFFKRKSK